MGFSHSPRIWDAFPQLAAGAMVVDGISPGVSVEDVVGPYLARATARIATSSTSELPEDPGVASGVRADGP